MEGRATALEQKLKQSFHDGQTETYMVCLHNKKGRENMSKRLSNYVLITRKENKICYDIDKSHNRNNQRQRYYR